MLSSFAIILIVMMTMMIMILIGSVCCQANMQQQCSAVHDNRHYASEARA